LNQSGDAVPDLESPQNLINLVKAINQLRAKGQVLAYHDRSDGGLFSTVAEMCFAGQVGVALNVDLLVTEGDGISDSRAEYGDAKNWAKQVSYTVMFFVANSNSSSDNPKKSAILRSISS
jgi:phosphoribosylformylglycinamidine synthase